MQRSAFVSPATNCSREQSFPYHPIQNWKKGVPLAPGQNMTVYVGDRASSRFLRIYDKQGHLFCISNGKQLMPHCTRFELEIKGARARLKGVDGSWTTQPALAQIVALHYIEQAETCIGNIFADFIRFVKPETNTRIERCETAWWWDAVISNKVPVNFGLQRGISDPEKSLEWFERCVLATERAAIEHGGMGEWFERKRESVPVTEAARKRWAEFKQAKGLKDNQVESTELSLVGLLLGTCERELREARRGGGEIRVSS